MAKRKFVTGWRPYGIPHNREEAVEACVYLNRLLHSSGTEQEAKTRKAIYEPQLNTAMTHWAVTWTEIALFADQHPEAS